MSTRRRFISWGLAAAGVTVLPEISVLAQQTRDFVQGPAVGDIAPTQLSQRVWYILSPDGFPTPENRGMMSNVGFVVTSTGVVILDSGSSLQIGQMAIRMIRRVTSKPVAAIFNTHFHGDHWLGNDAFVREFGSDLPIYALAQTQAMIKGVQGSAWRSLMERWTNQSTAGTQVVAPNRVVTHGQDIRIGDVTFRMHHYGRAHTESDLCVQVVEDQVTAVGDIAMTNRIANMDDGSYPGTLKYYQALEKAAGEQLWLPGHGEGKRDLLQSYGRFLAGIWEPCLQAVKDNKSEAEAKAMVLSDPRVSARAATMQGFQTNIGKYINLAYLEAEKEAF